MTLSVTFGERTDVGRERSENQDAVGRKHLDGVDVFIVCDGMGGHAGGSTAARLGIEVIANAVETLEGEVERRVERAIVAANATIFAHAQEDRSLRGMGTTTVVLAVDHEAQRAVYAHVGDSRIYLLRGNVFRRLTKDHTMVQRLVDDGVLPPEAAENHPNSNVISRSLGGRDGVDVEMSPLPIELQDGDLFVLCSDGLHGMVTEAEIGRIVADTPPEDAVTQLVDRANELGGHDNISVQVVLIGDQPEPADVIEVVTPPIGHRRVTPAEPLPPVTEAGTPEAGGEPVEDERATSTTAPHASIPPVDASPEIERVDPEADTAAADVVDDEVYDDDPTGPMLIALAVAVGLVLGLLLYFGPTADRTVVPSDDVEEGSGAAP